MLRRQAQPKKYRENILNVFRLFKKFQRVLEKQEHSGRTILRNAKRFNKPATVHKHAQPIPVRPQTLGPPNQITLLQGKVHAVSGRFGTDLEFVEKCQTATESFSYTHLNGYKREGFVSVSISIAIGIALGLLAGYFRGIVDEIIMRGVDVMLCFPSFFLILAVIAFL